MCTNFLLRPCASQQSTRHGKCNVGRDDKITDAGTGRWVGPDVTGLNVRWSMAGGGPTPDHFLNRTLQAQHADPIQSCSCTATEAVAVADTQAVSL
eukprot:366239-Chlamydomonas_euryale.AAC.17